ncbi:T-box protein 18 [Sarotherodon galilaeus]
MERCQTAFHYDREPELGDLIEISRDNYYKHWAVYVGAGFVVHFVNHSGVSSGASVHAANGTVRKEKIWDVVGKDKWKINNSMDRQYKPRPANVIVEDAKAMVGKELRYDVFSFNCEHFVNKLRYGVAESPQTLHIKNTWKHSKSVFGRQSLFGTTPGQSKKRNE